MSDALENNKKRKFLMVGLVLFIILFAGGFTYFSLFSSKKELSNIVPLNSTGINRAASDSFGSKADLYSSTDAAALTDKQGQETLLKGNDNLNLTGKETSGKSVKELTVNTNNSTEEDGSKSLQRRMKRELAPVAVYKEPVENVETAEEITAEIPTKAIKKKKNISFSSLDLNSRSSDFNSFNYKKASTKNIAINAPSTPIQLTVPETFAISNTVSDLANIIEPINCPAYVLQKTKINGNTTLVVELLEDMILPNGKTVVKGSRVSGYANINDTRINLNIQTINVNGKIERISLAAYDLDGMEGLTVKGARSQSSTTGAVNGTLGNASSVGETALGIPGQLAGGILRGILGTGRGSSVFIPAGYKLILKSSN